MPFRSNPINPHPAPKKTNNNPKYQAKLDHLHLRRQGILLYYQPLQKDREATFPQKKTTPINFHYRGCTNSPAPTVIMPTSSGLADNSLHGSKSTKKHSEAIAKHPASRNTLMWKHIPSTPCTASCKYCITIKKEPT